ncbi:MAG: DUF262 domain-containing protein [Clostridia bacterium]|nr:DUF262 domain-containing protein [Clostridia bacterium]
MEIELKEITVRDLFDGFDDDEDSGRVVAYGGRLNVRPAYQREFVYDDKKKIAVINSILHNYPLNVMYWSENEDGTYEMLDGQQRTISICDWLDNGFSVAADPNVPTTRYYAHTSNEITRKVLDYKLMIYICKGTDTEKLDWFKIINIAGEKLTEQELRNAVYSGEWLSDAKKYFSKNQCIAYKIGERYMAGSPIRQDYLQTVLHWISCKEGKSIEEYMAEHQHDTHATPLKQYYKAVIDWVELTFPKYRGKLMKGLNWGILFNEFNGEVYDPTELEKSISLLLQDDDVTNQKGVYEYMLSGRSRERLLSIRTFTDNEKRILFERQKGICPMCAAEGFCEPWNYQNMQADHIIPWSKGGHTTLDNGQMLCRMHNLKKSDF